jgi:16S rRNA (adenine1518-N6/adenine1519-N6)-dimethyltransferase
MYADGRMKSVRPKKSLGQHFLHDQKIAQRIVASLKLEREKNAVLEIGPGMGILTKFLIDQPRIDLKVIEIDRDSVAYLKKHYPSLQPGIIEGDFLEVDIHEIFPSKFAIIGNFPYNISSQIFFKTLRHRDSIDELVCMLQKEVAQRIAALAYCFRPTIRSNIFLLCLRVFSHLHPR